MGLKPVEFYAMSPLEFALFSRGYNNKKITEFKLNRNIVFTMARLWGSNVPKDPAEFWDLGDKTEHSEDEIAKLFEQLRQKEENG
jgi:hypothetical protein